MKKIEVLGPGCKKCHATYDLIEKEMSARNISVELVKVEDMAKILGYGVLSTPGIVLNGEVVHSGSVPSKKLIGEWLVQ